MNFGSRSPPHPLSRPAPAARGSLTPGALRRTLPPPGRRRRVLVVEDDPVVRTLVVKALSASYDAVEAVDGRAALEYIATEAPPDVIVADVTMPNVDGFTMTRALKADARTKKIPVLFLSARGLPRDVLESIAVGGCAYIQKPFAMDDLLDKVARAAEG